jgi:hypothetical protein
MGMRFLMFLVSVVVFNVLVFDVSTKEKRRKANQEKEGAGLF